MTYLIREDIVPSNEWTAMPSATRGRLVWARTIDDGKIATYWEVQEDGDYPENHRWMVRAAALPDLPGGGLQTVPPYYLEEHANLAGAVPFINAEVFLWVALLETTTPATAIIEDEPPAATTYPRNGIYEP